MPSFCSFNTINYFLPLIPDAVIVLTQLYRHIPQLWLWRWLCGLMAAPGICIIKTVTHENQLGKLTGPEGLSVISNVHTGRVNSHNTGDKLLSMDWTETTRSSSFFDMILREIHFNWWLVCAVCVLIAGILIAFSHILCKLEEKRGQQNQPR